MLLHARQNTQHSYHPRAGRYSAVNTETCDGVDDPVSKFDTPKSQNSQFFILSRATDG
jgi:hypothetical protein